MLGAHISSKWWGCPSACPATVVADRRGVPWVVAASTSFRVLCQVRKSGFESVQCQEEYRWHRGTWYILHLFQWPVVGLVAAWWALWQWPLVRARKQVVRLTYFPIGRLLVSGLCGSVAHVTFQD